MKLIKYFAFFLLLNSLVWGSSIFLGFSQDDFFHLEIARADSLRTFLEFFNPRANNWQFFRPLSTQVWYFMFERLFGWKNAAVPMHLAAIFIHSINTTLVFTLVKKIWKLKISLAFTFASLYAIASVHFLSLYYVGATQQLLASMFSLLVLHASLKNQTFKSSFFYLFALLSKELSLRLAPIVVLVHLLSGKSLSDSVKKSKNIIVLTLVYLLFRYLFKVVIAPEYTLDFSIFTTLATLMWYVLMSFGAPEYLLRFGLSHGQIDVLGYVSSVYPLSAINAVTVALSLILFVTILLIQLRKSPSARHFFPLALLWLAGIAPVLFLPTHRYSHYLDLSLFFVLFFLVTAKKSFLKVILIISLTTAFLSGNLLDRQTHWTIERSLSAQKYLLFLTSAGYCQYSTLYFVGSQTATNNLSYALMNEHGPQIACSRHDLSVYYSDTAPKNMEDDVGVIKVE